MDYQFEQNRVFLSIDGDCDHYNNVDYEASGGVGVDLAAT